MAQLELPCLAVHSIVATVHPANPVLINREPGPGEADVVLQSTVALELTDLGSGGIDIDATSVWLDDVLAFDEVPISPFNGSRSCALATSNGLRIVLDPAVPFQSQSVVRVRVRSKVHGAVQELDETYSFRVEDRSAPKLVAAVARSPRQIRLAFDEPILLTDKHALTISPLSSPAVPLRIEAAVAEGAFVELRTNWEMSPDVTYRVLAVGISDSHGNEIASPFNTALFQGYRPSRPATRRFDLWTMLPKHNRREDTTGDLARFIASLQEVTDLLLAEVDRFSDLFDIERAPEAFLDLILADLGNPFSFDLDTLGKRRLASVLVEMYRQRGTAVGIRNAIRFFLGIDIEAITGLAATALVLGESELGVDWELGPSDRFARYAFDVKVGQVLSLEQRKRMRVIVDYLRPAHTHFVNLLEPTPAIVADDWELGVSEVGLSSDLH